MGKLKRDVNEREEPYKEWSLHQFAKFVHEGKEEIRATQWIEKEIRGPQEVEASQVQLLIEGEKNARMRAKWIWRP